MMRKNHGLRQRPWALGLLLSACALLCTPAWSAGPTLTYEQLNRLLKVVDQRGTHAAIPRTVASVLQLDPKQLTPDLKEVAVLDEDGNRHGFAPLNDGSGFFMFRNGASMGHSVYRVDSALHLVRAARSLVKNGPLISLPEAEGQKELDEEFARWSKLLSPNGNAAAIGGQAIPYPFQRPNGPEAAPAPQPKQPEPAKP
jgi:hypothetical protein